MSNSHTVSLKETQRYEAFDSLRSLAALVVVLSHAAPMLRFDVDWPRHIAGFLDPRAAVVFFFVLSGFVLHLSFSKSADDEKDRDTRPTKAKRQKVEKRFGDTEITKPTGPE